MTLALTRELLAAAYDLLELTPPFVTWNLPSSDAVRFEVTKSRDREGDCILDAKGAHVIRVSGRNIGRLSSLVEVIAHEMVHVHIDRSGIRENEHGPAFRKLAAEVCRHHGFDPKRF